VKRFVKSIAAFCAMAMIFGVFSATVFADENEPQAEQPVAEEVAEEEKQDEEAVAEETAVETPAAEDPATEDPAAEESEADAEAPAQDSEQPVVEETLEVADVEGQEAVNEGEGNEEVPQQAIPPFANGQITQDDIDANGGMMPTVSGTYTVAEPVTVSASAELLTPGESITIDLNGQTITYTGVGSFYKLGYNEIVDGAIHVYGNISLTIKDSGTGGTILASGGANKGSVDHWVSITAKNGVAKIGTDEYRGGCILIENGCTFTFEGGTISGFHAGDEGGGVHTSNGGTFIMTGGCITGCSASKNSGGVAVHGASNGTTTNSSIYYHSNAGDDPVYGPVSIVASAYISGGVIENNTTSGVGGGIRALRGNIEITGGTITGNRANGGGGGIAATKGNVYTPSFTISGNPKISGNNSNSAKFSNLYFTDGASFTLSGDLDSGAEIYFNNSKPGGNSFITGSYTYSIDSFSSDDPAYIPYAASNGNIQLSTIPKVAGYNLVIGGEVMVRANLTLGSFNNNTTTVNYSYSYDKNGTTKNVEKSLTFYQLTKGGDYYYFYIPVESACMTSEITVTINYANGEASASSSVVECANYIINHETDQNYTAEAKAVAKSLIYFGSCAQLQFNINTDNMPANAVPGDPFYTYTGASYTPAQDPDSAYYGTSVAFLSMTTVNMYFKKSAFEGDAPAMTVTYDGGGSQTITATPNGNYYMYSIMGPSGNGFAATEVDLDFTYSVGNVNGTYSIFTYLQVVKDKYEESSGNVLLKLTEAYYDFAKKCLDYKNSVA
jgi:hypothetical protein